MVIAENQVINAHATSVPTNPNSRFSATSIKPALGSSFTFTSDISLLMQETGRLFGMVDEGERERIRTQPGLRAVVEALKSRVSVRPPNFYHCRLDMADQDSPLAGGPLLRL